MRNIYPAVILGLELRDVLGYRASVISLPQSVISRLLLFEKPLKGEKNKTAPQFSKGQMSHESE